MKKGAVCKECKRTDELCGINGDWYCPDHITVGMGRAFAPVEQIKKALGR